jgi:hypothetical protein
MQYTTKHFLLSKTTVIKTEDGRVSLLSILNLHLSIHLILLGILNINLIIVLG